MGRQTFRRIKEWGNKVDITEIEDFSNDLKEASADIKSSLAQVEEKIEQINNMKSFSGKAAKSAKQYFGEMHLTVLASFKGLFEDLEENLQQHMKTFESRVDSSDSAIIRSNYLQDVKEDMKETFEALQKQDEIISETIEDVSDISSATSPSFSEVDEWKKEAVKKINELDEDLDSFTGEGDEVDVQEVMQHIESVMNNAKTSEGKARFTDFEGASQGSNLAKLQAYNAEKAEDEVQEIEKLDQESQLYLQQANKDYEAGDIDKATYEAILSGILQSGSSFVASANKGKFSNSISKDLQEDIGQWTDNLYEKQEKTEENQKIYQDIASQGNVEDEDEQLLAFMGEVEEGNIDIDEVSVNDNEYPEEEPLGFWDKKEVAGGNSPHAGTPDGLAGPATFTFDIGKGTVDGFNDFAEDTIDGLATTVAHPKETGEALWNAVTNPEETFNVMTDAISTSYDRDVTNGNAESRSRWFTYAATTLVTTVGTGGAGAAPRVGTTAAKLAKKPVVKNTNRLNINNPFELKPALNMGYGEVPYNVYNENWITNQTFQFAKKFDDGKSKVGSHAQDNPMGIVKPVSNMKEFFKMEFGKSLNNSVSKSKVRYDGQSVYKVEKKTDSQYLKKGYGVYLDGLHKDHLEVIDKVGNVKYVLNLDGTLNIDKTRKISGRRVQEWK